MAFTLQMHPWIHLSKFSNGEWNYNLLEQDKVTKEEENKLTDKEKEQLLIKRNSVPGLPIVNYTTQYGMGCFEGGKAFPQKDGSVKLFRPDENAKRMHNSMKGLMMPAIDPVEMEKSLIDVIRKNYEAGYIPAYNKEWEKDNFLSADAVYIRPFTYSEPAVGLGLSTSPWVVTVTTNVSGYFKEGMRSRALVTNKVRAFKGGTGWIKADSNYVIPILVKKAAEKEGYMEAVFLDAVEHKYVEEGSSCNIFFVLEDGTLITPELGDTILPGITRKSVITIAKDLGFKIEERRVTIEEVMNGAVETFVTGTAAGVTHFESLTYKGKERIFGDGKIGPITKKLQSTLKGIQYGLLEDKHGWMKSI
jgi:branched-chain amino acid aminotransferase